MSEKKDILETMSNVVALSKAYRFEEEEVTSVDLTGLENITADQMILAQKMITRSGNVTTILETNLEYLLILASMASGMPIEFFKKLNAKDTIKIKNRVSGFFFAGE